MAAEMTPVDGMTIHCSHDELVRVSELKPHPKNRNQHPKEQVTRLARILKYQGWRYPVKVSKLSGYVTSGHGRISAAKENGWEYVPVNFQDYDDDTQEYADVTSDNAIASWAELDLGGINNDVVDLGPDFDIDLLGIEGFVLEPADKHHGDADDVPPVPEVATTKPGDLFSLGDHRLLCGDSTLENDVQRLMTGEKADMVFTSPPYSDLREYGGNLNLEVKHLCKIFDWPTDLFFVNLGLIVRERQVFRYWDQWLSEAEARGRQLLSWNIWDKGKAGGVGHQQTMFGISHEWIFALGAYRKLNLTKPNSSEQWGTPTIRQKDGSLKISTFDGEIRTHRQLDTVLSLQCQKNIAGDYTGHPAQFPVTLPECYINAATQLGESVSDPFLGSGSTLIACEKTNRRCFGMEIDPLYCDVIIKRWETFTGKKAVLIEKAG